ncbi:uncharacterized protein LOC119976364 [Scyliorhinus canicula]|uniref:uncharacterized protein LOC119976364 n=1 Tax=Scyliorhinus canicula TaxID=7830 RepID=UPI0018F2C7A7|nr:uncharacterized protein LOC119976364 [Scyliorhinus canicula]XP_038672776.1 uncharacterized protein LOC119976364 [Scyliorhinus canicula]XP_038672777.1 uncharacterized protein LOC119976364 [Scyliorhinus canicula]
MAARPSQHQRKGGAIAKQPMPQEAPLPPAAKAASPRGSGSGSRGGRATVGNPSSAKHSSEGRLPKPTANTRNPEAQRSAKSITRGAAGGTRPTAVVGNANSESKTLGKATGTKSQADQLSNSSRPAMISKQRIADIEKETRGQRENPAWFEQRRNRITASVAHKISHCNFVNGKSTEVPQSYLKPIVGQGSKISTPAMKWGVENESVAVKKYEKLKSEKTGREISVQQCGLFVDPVKNWLAASPDGVVVDKATGDTIGLLEVKCPYKHRNHTISQSCEDRNFCLENKKGEPQLKKGHSYFTQIQCQLAVLDLPKADLVVYTNREVAIIPVEFDEKFWKKSVDKLEDFYTRAVLPEIRERNLALASEE